MKINIKLTVGDTSKSANKATIGLELTEKVMNITEVNLRSIQILKHNYFYAYLSIYQCLSKCVSINLSL